MADTTQEATTPITLGVIKQTTTTEKRVGATPESITRLKRQGVTVLIESGAGDAAWFTDALYEKAGAQVKSRDEVLAQSDVVGFIDVPTAEDVAALKNGQYAIGMFGSRVNEELTHKFEAQDVVALDMTLLPRQLSSAQSMDAMTSQASVVGYKAVIVAADAFGRFFPMLTTAAGTIRPAQILILGAGIAGLQAIGTAKRLGAAVTAYDVRPAAQEEVESLGAKFLQLDTDFSAGQGEGGYARQLTAEEQAQQQAQVDTKAADFDIIITTAQVPGRKPPVLLTAAGVAGLKNGSVIVDCAASALGGNVEGSQPEETITTENGVTIIGAPSLASSAPTAASNMLARNIADVLTHIIRDGAISLDMNDPVDDALVISHRPAVTPAQSEQ